MLKDKINLGKAQNFNKRLNLLEKEKFFISIKEENIGNFYESGSLKNNKLKKEVKKSIKSNNFQNKRINGKDNIHELINKFLPNDLPMIDNKNKCRNTKIDNLDIFERMCKNLNFDKIYITKNEQNTHYTVRVKRILKLESNKLDLQKISGVITRNRENDIKSDPKKFDHKVVFTDTSIKNKSLYSQFSTIESHQIKSKNHKIKSNFQKPNISKLKFNKTQVLPIFSKMNNNLKETIDTN